MIDILTKCLHIIVKGQLINVGPFTNEEKLKMFEELHTETSEGIELINKIERIIGKDYWGNQSIESDNILRT